MQGGTFCISNLGKSCVDFFTPIINTPQLAILGIGRMQKTPWVDAAGDIVVATVMGFSLTVDHRFIDGVPAAAFLGAFVEALQEVAAA